MVSPIEVAGLVAIAFGLGYLAGYMASSRHSGSLWAQNAQLIDSLVGKVDHEGRIGRVKAGLSEVSVPEDNDPMPEELVELCMRFTTSGQGMLSNAKRLHRAGAPWDMIYRQYVDEMREQAPHLFPGE